jgi:hypothetical protein
MSWTAKKQSLSRHAFTACLRTWTAYEGGLPSAQKAQRLQAAQSTVRTIPLDNEEEVQRKHLGYG